MGDSRGSGYLILLKFVVLLELGADRFFENAFHLARTLLILVPASWGNRRWHGLKYRFLTAFFWRFSFLRDLHRLGPRHFLL